MEEPIHSRAFTATEIPLRRMTPRREEISRVPRLAFARASANPAIPVRKPLASLCLLFAWLCANGALLETVQLVAWTKMFTGYAQSMSVTAALRATFDPAKPCEMCLGVAAAKETAREQLPQAVEHSAEKLFLALHTPGAVVFQNSPEQWLTTRTIAAPARAEAVPVPPPRV